jgi:Integrase core domain
MMEAFFSTLKTECFPENQVFSCRAQARREIFEYIELYYNNQRFHSALSIPDTAQLSNKFGQVIDIESDRAQSLDTATEDRALQGRTLNAAAALQTAGVAAYGRPLGRYPPAQAQSVKSQGFGGQSHPIPVLTLAKHL